jgi:steroid delta-isomerase-like uncharacterized protein
MSAEENIAAVRQVTDAMNTGNLAAFDELYASDYVIHVAGWPDLDREGFRKAVAELRQAFPDFEILLDDIFATDERVAFRFTHRGTHRGEYFGVPPTGKQMTWGGIVISRFEAGRWVEDWEFSDTLGLLQQLGVVSLPQDGES